MKKTWVLCFLLLCLGFGTVCAAGNDKEVGISERTAAILRGDDSSVVDHNSKMPQVLVLYINNAKTEYNGEIDTKIMDHLKTLAANRWVLVPGDSYKDKLSAMGIQSLTMAERADILAVTKDSEADAILVIEVEPFNIRDVMTFFTVGKKVTTSIPVKIIDRSTNLYLYNGKFVEMGQENSMLGIGNKSVIMKALDLAFDKFDQVIPEKLANVKHSEKEAKTVLQ